jgi:hypothetical protein
VPLDLEAAVAAAAERGAARALAGSEDRIVGRVLAEIEKRWPQPDSWLTRRELAAQLQVSVDTLDRRIAGGDATIEVQKIGRAVRCRLRPRVSETQIARLAAEARA